MAIVIGVKARKADYKQAPRGLLLLAEMGVGYIDDWTVSMMGHKNVGRWPGYFCGLWIYLFLAFNWSLTGFPSIVDYLVVPFSLSLVMFVLIVLALSISMAVNASIWKQLKDNVE